MNRNRTEALIGLGLVVITAFLFWPATGYDFVLYDDNEYVFENPRIIAGLSWAGLKWAFTSFDVACWQPITWISYMLDWSCYGGYAGGFHLTNLLLHALNTLLVFLLLRGLTPSPWPRAFVAALFGWHPLHVESVAWIAERKDLLSTLFLLLTVWSYAGYVKRPRIPRYFATLLLFALGLMSKSMLVTLPVLLLLLDFWPLNRFLASPGFPDALQPARKSLTALLLEKLPFFALSAGSCVVTVISHFGEAGLVRTPFSIRLWNAPVAIVTYLWNGLWPAGLCVHYPLPSTPPLVSGLMASAALAGICWLVLRYWRSYPWLTVGWLWYLAGLAPVLGLIQLGTHARADRYTYVPFIGLFVAVVWQVMQSRPNARKQFVWAAFSLAALAACLLVSRTQLQYWRDSISLATRAITVTEGNFAAHNILGVALAKAGKPFEAIAHYQESYRIFPTDQARYNLALELTIVGQLDEAARHFSELLKSAPDNAPLHNNYGLVLARQHQTALARSHFAEAARLSPDFAKAHFNYALASQQLSNASPAAAAYRRALELEPVWPECLSDLAFLLAFCPEPECHAPATGVELALRAAQQTGNTNALCLDTLALCYAANGRFSNALAAAEQALPQAVNQGLTELAEQIAKDLEDYRAERAPGVDWTTPLGRQSQAAAR